MTTTTKAAVKAVKSVTIQVRVTAQERAALDAVVAQGLGDRSDHVREALRRYVAQAEAAASASVSYAAD